MSVVDTWERLGQQGLLFNMITKSHDWKGQSLNGQRSSADRAQDPFPNRNDLTSCNYSRNIQQTAPCSLTAFQLFVKKDSILPTSRDDTETKIAVTLSDLPPSKFID